MKSTILYTGYDDAYAPLAAITVPRMEQYAAKHGLDFKAYTEPLIDVPNGIYWTGVCGALKAFEDGYERVFYLDSDQLITNMEFQIPDWKYGFHASKDWGNDAVEPWQFSMCGFLAHNSVRHGFSEALNLEPEWRDKPFPEQGPMQYIVRNTLEVLESNPYLKEKFGKLNNIHSRKVFNCVPDQISPGNVPQPWSKGDFAAHLTMAPLERRIEIAKEILNEIG